MADPQVKSVQKWLLEKYSGKPEFDRFVLEDGFVANGNTGNNTMKALRMAIQYELFIVGPTGNFGPATLKLLPTVGYGQNPTNKTIIKLLEGAMWCHGYYPGGIFDPLKLVNITEQMDIGLRKFKIDVGFVFNLDEDTSFSPHYWKSLFSTDAFVTTWTDGNFRLQEIQKRLNRTTINGYGLSTDYLGGFVGCDGLPSRDFSKLLIFYLQALMGLSPSEATGNFGPATQNSLPILPDDNPSADYFVILVASLIANGYKTVDLTTSWTSQLHSSIVDFQEKRAIPITGKVDKTTWMSLLISHGDQSRNPNAGDTRFEMTPDRIGYLKSKGIKYIGRYLTGGDFKELRLGEPQRIQAAGITVFPIFQDSRNTTHISYYSKAQALVSAEEAETRARVHRFPEGTPIYFAVDLDTYGWQIDEVIVPYFKVLTETLKNYKVGIYATRLGCTKVMEAGYATSSFVANMSSQWSGNLGFPMPNNWTFEQYLEISRIPGSMGLWDLDYCIFSGQQSVPQIGDPNEDMDYSEALKKLNDFGYSVGKSLNLPNVVEIKTVKQDQNIVITDNEFVKISVRLSMTESLVPLDGVTIATVKDGSIMMSGDFKTFLGTASVSVTEEQLSNFENANDMIAMSIHTGKIVYTVTLNEYGLPTINVNCASESVQIGQLKKDLHVKIVIENKMPPISLKPIPPEPAYEYEWEPVLTQPDPNSAITIVGFFLILGIVIFTPAGYVGGLSLFVLAGARRQI